MDLIVDIWENLVIINWESIKLMGELFGYGCFDFDDFEDIQYLPNRN